jgi:hypothetical protein
LLFLLLLLSGGPIRQGELMHTSTGPWLLEMSWAPRLLQRCRWDPHLLLLLRAPMLMVVQRSGRWVLQQSRDVGLMLLLDHVGHVGR